MSAEEEFQSTVQRELSRFVILMKMRQKVWRKHRHKQDYSSLSDMLEKEKPDVWCVCTPSGMHGAHAVEEMGRDINVLCEELLDIKSD